MGSENLLGMYKTQGMALVLNFLEQYLKDSDEFVGHIG
jgi:hypothetical protein